MTKSNVHYKWRKLFAGKRFHLKANSDGDIILSVLEQQELLDDLEKEFNELDKECRELRVLVNAKTKFLLGK